MNKYAVLFPLVALLAGCATRSVLEDSRDFTRLGNHFQAFHTLDQERRRLQASGQEPSEEFQTEYRKAEIAYWIDKARREIFEEREEAALAILADVEGLGAEAFAVQFWRERATLKIAVRETLRGNEMLTKGELEEAMRHFLAALDRKADHAPAHEGAEKVRVEIARMTERAQQQFLEAVRRMPEFRYVEAQWHAQIATENDPAREDAKTVLAEARAEVLEQMFARGKELQRADKFGAALVEYKAIERIDPGYPGVKDAIAAMTREVDALRLVEKAKVDMRMERFASAKQLLGDALQLSEQSRAVIGELQTQCETLRGEAAYRDARDLEILGKKEEAIAAYRAIVAGWPKGIADAAARADALQVDVDGALAEWNAAEAAEAAGNDAEALESYRNAQRYHAGFRDVAARIARLTAKLQAGGGDNL